MKAVNIAWDCDEDLPEEVELPVGMTDEDEISDYLTDLTGYCHYGFNLEQTLDDKVLELLKNTRITSSKDERFIKMLVLFGEFMKCPGVEEYKKVLSLALEYEKAFLDEENIKINEILAKGFIRCKGNEICVDRKGEGSALMNCIHKFLKAMLENPSQILWYCLAIGDEENFDLVEIMEEMNE